MPPGDATALRKKRNGVNKIDSAGGVSVTPKIPLRINVPIQNKWCHYPPAKMVRIGNRPLWRPPLWRGKPVGYVFPVHRNASYAVTTYNLLIRFSLNGGSSMSQFFRFQKVMDVMAMSRSTVHLRVKQGLLTPPVKLGERCTVWPEHEISAINNARLAQKSNDEIRELVIRLKQERQTSAA